MSPQYKNMTIEQTLQKAREGGYEPLQGNELHSLEYAYLLDPKFFQSLGKAMGDGKAERGESSVCLMPFHGIMMDCWKVRWLRFIE